MNRSRESICPVCNGRGRDDQFNNICDYCQGKGTYRITNINSTMEETIGINLELPKEFSLELDQYILDQKKLGVTRISKADLIIKFARMQFLKEKV